MNFEQALRAELVTLSGLSNKVFPLNAPEGTATPFVVYAKANTDYIKSMDGTQLIRQGRYDIDVLAQTYSALQDQIVAIKNKILSFEGRIIGTGGPFVQSVQILNLIEMYENQVQFYRGSFEIIFYYGGA